MVEVETSIGRRRCDVYNGKRYRDTRFSGYEEKCFYINYILFVFLQYVAAFAVSAVSCNWQRIGKPFNPLLGETYELERDNFR